jgi:TolB-like protein
MTERFDINFSRIRRLTWMTILIAAAGLSQADASPRQAAIKQIPFHSFAQQLLSGIDKTDSKDIPAIGGYGKPRLAVVPFTVKKSVISATLATEFNDRLLAELTRQGRHRYRFIARETLKSVIRDIDSINELEPGRDSRVADLLRSARVDILVIGNLRKDGARMILSYKAVSVEDGMVFAATEPRHIAFLSKPPIAAPHRRNPVFRVQRLLSAAGFDPGLQNGVMQQKTRRAIRKFQRSRGLAVNGRLTRALYRALRRSRETVLALP